MAIKGMMTVASVFLGLVLGLLYSAPAASSSLSRACCTSYTRQPIPFQRIMGYKEQSPLENCNIEAIIFYTVKKKQICASPKDDWVRKTLSLLSIKLKKMSKRQPAVGNTKKRSGNPLVTDGSRVILSTTETYQNLTESFTGF